MHPEEKIALAKQGFITERSLDHFVSKVGDVETGAEMYRRLGFNVMPVMEHEDIGTANVCIQFFDTYVELIGDFRLARRQLTALDEPWTAFGDYIYWKTSLTSEKLETTKEELEALGFAPKDILHATRKVRLVGGGWDSTASRSMYTLNKERITGSMFHSDHPKPEAIWIPEYQVHPNSAVRIIGMSYLCEDPQQDADYYTKMIGGEPASFDGERVAFHTPRGEFLEFIEANKAAEHLPAAAPLPAGLPVRGSAYTIQVESLPRCQMALRSGGVPFTENDGALFTPAPFGAGMAIHFVEVPNENH